MENVLCGFFCLFVFFSFLFSLWLLFRIMQCSLGLMVPFQSLHIRVRTLIRSDAAFSYVSMRLTREVHRMLMRKRVSVRQVGFFHV